MAIYAIPRQRLSEHRGAATAGLAIAIFVSGLGLGATIATNAGIVSNVVSMSAPARDLNVISLQQHRALETSLGASNRASGTSSKTTLHFGVGGP